MAGSKSKGQLPTQLRGRVDLVDLTQAETRDDEKALRELLGMPSPDLREPGAPWWLASIGIGARGRHGGRIPYPVRAPRHYESTRAIRGLYPWLAGRALPTVGPMMGRSVYSGGAFCFDPWQLRGRGLLGDFGIFISGVIGSGKSSCAKSFCLRNNPFGRPFVVSGDIRGEWVPVAEAVGGRVLRLGPGMPNVLNCLAMPPRPDGIDAAAWWLTVRTHWESLLEALAETVLRARHLTATETTGIEAALTEATGYDSVGGDLSRVRPISLGRVVDLVLDPTVAMAETVKLTREQLGDALRDVGLALRKLTRGSLQGLVNSDAPTNQIDPRSPATVVDISRIRTSDAAIGLVMACSQSVLELAMAHRTRQWIVVYDELWRLLKYPALVARIDAGQRVSRGSGAATIGIMHRLTDGQNGDPAAERAIRDLMANCSTKVLYKQRSDAIAETAAMLRTSDMVMDEVRALRQGRAVWLVEDDAHVVDHLLLPDNASFSEHAVINTDQALLDDYRALDGDGWDQWTDDTVS